MIKCPTCQNGTITITATEISVTGTKKLAPVTIDCIDCNGTGEISQKKFQELQNYKNAWCKCEHEGNPIFHNDGNEICGKHCVTCSTCGKLLQIG